MNTPTVYNVNPNTLTEVDIDLVDRSLVSSYSVDGQFTPGVDSVEAYYYDEGKRLLRSDYNYTTWTSHLDPTLAITAKLEDLYIDPAEDGKVLGVVNGSVYLQYQFVTNKLGSSSERLFYINSISTDRTEITLKSNDISNIELSSSLSTFIGELSVNTGYFNEFYLNFGNNNKEIGVNIEGITNSVNDTTILVKLYKPLPLEFNTKNTLWIQTFLADPIAYKVEYDEIIDLPDNTIRLKGPNTSLSITGQESKSTIYQTYNSLKTTSSSSLANQVDSILAEKGVELNIDYRDFSNFVHFSSAKKRLENFYYKASLLEKYQAGINAIKTLTTSSYQASSLALSESVVREIITNFDGYEYFLYYSSESKAWPKTNSTPPYTLASTASVQALTWYGSDDLGSAYYGGQLFTASYYDNENQDNLLYSIPEYLREDESNQPYEYFIEMIGQYFDNLFLYTDQITTKYNADNRLDYGISKDLVADTLRSFGLNIYENNFTAEDIYTALTGLTPSGSILPLPNISTTYPVTSIGVEYIQTIVSASNELVTLDDLNKSIYKRLYHNLPLLVKKKGTLAGLQLLINNFGIPDTILRINEFGGKDKLASTWDQWQQQYDYAYNTKAVGFVTSSFVLNSSWNATSDNPSAVEFRFKTPGIPSSSFYSQSLWSTNNGVVLTLKYTGSGLTSGSYSGSVIDPYYEYGLLEFYPNSSNLNTTASIYLPFFDGGWWSVLINKNSSTDFTVYAKNKIYNGDSGNILGFQGSSSVTLANSWESATTSYFGTSSFAVKNFSGSLQELRFYSQPISESTFDAYVMNPGSIEQSEFLAFRASLGGELYTASISIHPKVSGEQSTTSSFTSDSTFFVTSSGEFISNTETVFYDQVAAGLKNTVSNRIRTGEDTTYGTVLSNQISVQQHTGSTTFTPNVNYLEVGFSPQNEINDDINSQLGYFNIGEYIGDPRFISESSYRYPALDTLNTDYFKKYSSSYNFNDYFRLIKFFDNSLFKLIKDFVPARTAAATGAIVKQHLLERNRQRPAQVDYSQPEYTGSVTSLPRDYQTGSIEVFTGGAGGSVNVLTNISQSWTSSILTKVGLITEIESSQYEFYNGEYSGSNVECQISYSLNTSPLLNNVSSSRISTFYEDVDYGSNAFNPVNLRFIQSGSATPAAIQDSNYAITSSWSQLRYEGSANTGNYNTAINFAPQSQAPGYPIDNFNNYFARFSYDASADPEYPGGGVFKLVELISIDGTRIPLVGDNKYLSFVSEIFKAGKTVTAYGRNVSVIKTVTDLPVIEGGGFYNTIVYQSGSVPITTIYSVDAAGGNYSYGPFYFVSSSLNPKQLTTKGATNGWLTALVTGSETTYGTIDKLITYTDQFKIYNTKLSQYSSNGAVLNYEDTYLPIQYSDIVRFGIAGGSISSSVDYSFSGLGTYGIISSSATTYNNSSSIFLGTTLDTLTVNEVLNIANTLNQNFRIFRRIPDETFVVVNTYAQMNVDPAVGGLLIPNDFNPAYDPITVARQAGIEL